jgi:hypothetical protein
MNGTLTFIGGALTGLLASHTRQKMSFFAMKDRVERKGSWMGRYSPLRADNQQNVTHLGMAHVSFFGWAHFMHALTTKIRLGMFEPKRKRELMQARGRGRKFSLSDANSCGTGGR